MDQNNYQPVYEQPVYQQPTYQQPNALPFDIQQGIEKAFSKSLAAIIMSGLGFPIVSLIGMIFGSGALKIITELYSNCTLAGVTAPGKLKTAKILATIAKWLGLANTIMWALLAAFYAFYFVFLIFVMIIGGF